MEDMRNEAARDKAKKMVVYLIKSGKMTLAEIAEATELSIDTIKELK
jgi:predicted HTH domain antitoxin